MLLSPKFIRGTVFILIFQMKDMSFIRVEGFNTPPFRALKKGIKPRIQIPIKNNIPRPFRAGLLITLIFSLFLKKF